MDTPRQIIAMHRRPNMGITGRRYIFPSAMQTSLYHHSRTFIRWLLRLSMQQLARQGNLNGTFYDAAGRCLRHLTGNAHGMTHSKSERCAPAANCASARSNYLLGSHAIWF